MSLFYDDLSWLIRQKVEEEISKLPSPPVDWHQDDNFVSQAAKKYIAVLGEGPHDFNEQLIKPGDEVLVAMNSRQMARAEVIAVKKNKVQLVRTRMTPYSWWCGTFTPTTRKQWYGFPGRMVVQ